MATILILELIGGTVKGWFGQLADNLADVLSDRIQIERMISGEYNGK